MTTARQFLDFVGAYSKFKAVADAPETALRELSDDQLMAAVLVAAGLFKMMKTEAIRRGVWDSMKGQKVS